MKKLPGKIAIVTGAGSGMGEAITKKLCALGATVIATDINEASLQATVGRLTGPGRVVCRYQDVTDEQAFFALVQDTVKEHGKLDYIFNNAGIAIAGEVKNNVMEDWKKTIDINQMGVIYGTLAAYEVMRTQGFGHIVNTASVAGLVPTPMLTAYSMTKHAVLGLTLSLREEAKVYGVNLNVVCPGIVKTNIVHSDRMRDFDLGNDPFDYVQQHAKINAISADEAALHILNGVARNDAEIVFPLHGKMMVRTYRNLRKAWEVMNSVGLRAMRQ